MIACLMLSPVHGSSRRRLAALGVRIAVGAVLLLSLDPRAHALVVGATNGVAPNTTVNPASYGDGWTLGDPGWNNVAIGSNFVYLGDGWVLSARHAGSPLPTGIQFQTPTGLRSFHRIPGSYYTDYGYELVLPWGHQYAVSNPTSIGGLTQFTDLQLFRINEDPGLGPLKIASQQQSPPLGGEVVFVTNGHGRQAEQTQWNVTVGPDDPDGTPHWDWHETIGSGAYQGYKSESNSVAKRWGTNHLSTPGGFNAFRQSLTGTTGVITVTGRQEDLIAMVSKYDKMSSNDFEAQVIAGDSGGAVFRHTGTQWELAGILNAALFNDDQPNRTAMYDNASIFADLSYYYYPTLVGGNPHPNDYMHSISDIMRSHADYSVMGDVNLDGIVSGDGTGSWATDDVTAFVAGWGDDNGDGKGTLTSWRSGDLNRDGKTDVEDFLVLRAALNGQISGAVLTSLFGSTAVPGSFGVPEPGAIPLAFLATWLIGFTRRRRRFPLR